MNSLNGDIEKLKRVIKSARGEEPLDLIIEGGKVISVFTGELLDCDVGIKDGIIATLDAKGLKAEATENIKGRYLSPSFIDGHIHVESSMLCPERFAEAVIPRGTGAVVTDPHEIANVLGIPGILYMKKASSGLPMDFYFTLPSCVPATHLETAGAEITPADIRKLLELIDDSPALSEMMNFPGVLFCDDNVLQKIIAAKEKGLKIDGHAPMVTGRDLDAYLSAGIGTDHESTSRGEAMEKLRKGCFILAREGSASKNLKEIIKAMTPGSLSRFAIVSDDRHPEELIDEGHLDHSLRKAVEYGMSPLDAVRLVTINPAVAFSLPKKGAVAPGYYADLVVLKDLKTFEAETVFHRGMIAARNGRTTKEFSLLKDDSVLSSVILPENIGRRLDFPEAGYVNTIKVFGDQILTKKEVRPASEARTGEINFAAVIERHGKNGNIGIGFVSGFGLKRGAIASTVSHDSHNIVAIGATPEEIAFAAKALAETGGGYVIVEGGDVLARLPLKVAGLMSQEPAAAVAAALKELHKKARYLGTELPSPLMTMSFIALPVIPEIRLTDKGVVDVGQFSIVPLMAE
jgi:adenine deaminase